MPDGMDLPDPPFDPEEAEEFRRLFDPLQSITGVENSLGTVLEDAPYPPVRLLGLLMQLNAQTIDTALTAGETVPNAIEVWLDAQEQGTEALAPPPPDQVVADIRDQLELLREARRQIQQG